MTTMLHYLLKFCPQRHLISVNFQDTHQNVSCKMGMGCLLTHPTDSIDEKTELNCTTFGKKELTADWRHDYF